VCFMNQKLPLVYAGFMQLQLLTGCRPMFGYHPARTLHLRPKQNMAPTLSRGAGAKAVPATRVR